MTETREASSSSGALEELYKRHAGRAVRMAYLLTADRGLAEEAVQDAFVRLVGRLAHLRDPDAFEAYFRKTVINLVRMQFRRRRIERAYLEGERAIAPRSSDPDPIGTYAMRQALLNLSLRQRAALVLRYYEDLDDVRIGELLGCSRSNVRSLVHRGLASLRDQLGGD